MSRIDNIVDKKLFKRNKHKCKRILKTDQQKCLINKDNVTNEL